MKMKVVKLAGMVALIGILAACSSPQDKAAKADAEVANRRLELIDQYQKCVKDAEGDQQKVDACDSYLKAADALQ